MKTWINASDIFSNKSKIEIKGTYSFKYIKEETGTFDKADFKEALEGFHIRDWHGDVDKKRMKNSAIKEEAFKILFDKEVINHHFIVEPLGFRAYLLVEFKD